MGFAALYPSYAPAFLWSFAPAAALANLEEFSMAIERELWAEEFADDSIPHFVCPRCNRGRLTLMKGSLRKDEPTWSQDAHSHDAWDPEWITQRFSLHAQCGMPKCGEVVCISGKTRSEIVQEGDDGLTVDDILIPEAMVPAPPIISLPKGTPDAVAAALNSSFGLFWSDLGAAASRMRLSVERLMDHFGIVKTRIQKAKNQGKGKRVPLDLSPRIDKFASATKTTVDPKTLHALRRVGNLGTHGADVTRDALLDGYTVYEDALEELIGRRNEKIARLVKKLNATSGKY
jgi:hypothetical protein